MVKPATAKSVTLSSIQRPANAEPVRIEPKSTSRTLAKAVSNNTKLTKRKTAKRTQVTFKTRDPSPESLAKIHSIRSQGLGRYLVIVGNGPSVGETDIERLRSLTAVDICSINKPCEKVWPTKYWAFFDRSQFKRHHALWLSYDGHIFNSTSITDQKQKSMQFKYLNGLGWSRDLVQGVYIGRSSVYATLQIGLWMNYKEIFVFGCDMDPDGINGKLHFYGDNPDVDPKVRGERFAKEADSYAKAAEILDETERARIVFCSAYNKWPFVNSFRRLDHREAVEHIIQLARAS